MPKHPLRSQSILESHLQGKLFLLAFALAYKEIQGTVKIFFSNFILVAPRKYKNSAFSPCALTISVNEPAGLIVFIFIAKEYFSYVV